MILFVNATFVLIYSKGAAEQFDGPISRANPRPYTDFNLTDNPQSAPSDNPQSAPDEDSQSAPDENSQAAQDENSQSASEDAARPATEVQLKSLEAARELLLILHRGLLQVERTRYEKVRGRIANNSAFLQLVISDPWFDWLRPMAQLVLLIDERTSDKKSVLGEREGDALLLRARGMLRADADGDAFQRLYYQAVQASPELAVIARQVASGKLGAGRPGDAG